MKKIYLIHYLILLFSITPIILNAQTRKIIKPSNELINFYYNSPQGKEALQHYQGNKKLAVKDLVVTTVDIDRDRNPEYFIKRKSFCNGQDCLVSLYKKKGRTFVELFSAQNLDIGEEWDAKGMRNLKSCAVDSMGVNGICTYYKWDNNQYVVFKCVEAESDKSKLKANIVPCSRIEK